MSATSLDRVDLSVVVPCYDERDCIADLVREIDGVLDGLTLRSEILVVDDTVAVLEVLRARHPRLRVALHSLNCGQSAAVATGLACSRGDLLATLDGDGQNDPADLPRLLEALDGTGGHDAVCGVRRRRRDSWVKRASSRVGNRFRDLVTGDRVSDAGCALRVLRRAAISELPIFNGMHRFLPTLLRAQGYDVIELDVDHRPRTAGRSKYGIGNRLWRGIADCVAVRWYRRRAVRGRRLAALGAASETPPPRAATPGARVRTRAQ